MTPHFRPSLALTIALPLLACDPGSVESSEQFRNQSTSATGGTTVQLGAEQAIAIVSSYSVGGELENALSDEGFDALLAGAQQADVDAQLVLRLDGVALPSPAASIDGAFVQLRRGDEVLDYPYKQFKFKVEWSHSGHAVTELVLDAASADGDGFTLWHDGLATSASPPPGPIETVEYELVDADGNSTTCRAEAAPVDQLSFGFTPIKGATGRFDFDIAAECADIIEAAADSSPPDAFFVRCDSETTTASVGMHKPTDITLKRGVVTGTGELVVESSEL